MTYKEAVDWMSCLRNVSESDVSNMLGTWYKGIKSDFDKAVNLAIEALEGKYTNVPSKDTVSRQDAISGVRELYSMGDCYCDECSVVWMLNSLPSSQPERKKGEWILVTDNNGQHYECSRCGAWRYHQEQEFCGSCGADMRGKNNGKTN